MQGADEVTGPQLMAEIGDVRRFTHKSTLVAFAGMERAALPVRYIRLQVPPYFQARLSPSAKNPVHGRRHDPSAQAYILIYGQKGSRRQALLWLHWQVCEVAYPDEWVKNKCRAHILFWPHKLRQISMRPGLQSSSIFELNLYPML